MTELEKAIEVYCEQYTKYAMLFAGEDISVHTFKYKKDILMHVQNMLRDPTGVHWQAMFIMQLKNRFDAFRTGLKRDIRDADTSVEYKIKILAAFEQGFGQALILLLDRMLERARLNHH